MALNIEKSLKKCHQSDIEIRIEAAMLAATHWINADLHDRGVTSVDQDIIHTYLLTINEYRRLSVASKNLLSILAEIEDLRPLHVRGDAPHGEHAAARADLMLSRIRKIATGSFCDG